MALPRDLDLYELLKDYEREIGYPIELDAVASRGGSWSPDFIVDHHTASRATSGDLPCRSICKYGRSDVPGPLAHLLTGRSGRTLVLCRRGRTNNAGRCNGTAVSRMIRGHGVTDANRAPGPDTSGSGANSHSIGHEKENDGLGETWTRQCLEAGAGVQAAICKEAGWDPRLRIAQHKALSRRKIDSSYDGYWWWEFVAEHPILGGVTPMTPEQEKRVYETLDAINARLGAIDQELDTVRQNQSTFETDTRILLEGRTVRLPGDNRQFVVVPSGSGLKAIHVKNLDELELLKQAGVIGPSTEWNQVEVREGAVNALRALVDA